MDEKEFWKIRAGKYNELEWVTKKDIIRSLIDISDFKNNHVVLDAGCGTGKVATSVYHLVDKVYGIDISEAMMSSINKEKFPHLNLDVGDIKNMHYDDDMFDRIIARLVFHHIIDDKELDKAVKECHRVLKKGGKILISEGVPPVKDVEKDFTEIFKLKEKRRTLTSENTKDLLEKNGFKNVKVHFVRDREMSIRNWLDNSGDLSDETKQKIFDMHKHSSEIFKKAYNLKDTGDDILIDVKVAIVTGEK